MVVFAMTNAPESLRGELTKWMLEPKAGVLVGNITAPVRDRLWAKICSAQNIEHGALMLYTTNNEQGFTMEIHGDPLRTVEYLDGIQLIKIQPNRDIF